MLAQSKHSSGDPETDALAECVMVLVKAIERHLVIADEKDAEEFRSGLCRLEDGLHESVETRVRVDAVVKLLASYATQTNQVIGRQRLELARIASDLNAGNAGIQDLQKAGENLCSLEERIERIKTSADLQRLKSELIADISSARDSVGKLERRMGGLISGTVDRLHASQEHVALERSLGSASLYAIDPLTGLPGRAYAQNELAKIHAQFPDCLIAFFVVKRLNIINAKFGFSRGDEVLLKVVQNLAQLMPDFNNLCRWSPCSFLIITAPTVTAAELRGRVHTIELLRMTPTLEWEGHSALVPIAMDCRAMSLKEFGSPDSLFRRLDGIASTI